MSEQGEFKWCSKAHARRNDPATSKEAASSLSAEVLTKVEVAILGALRDAGDEGCTTREIAEVTGIDWGTITPRLKPMEEKGAVMRTDKLRMNPSGRRSLVWIERKHDA